MFAVSLTDVLIVTIDSDQESSRTVREEFLRKRRNILIAKTLALAQNTPKKILRSSGHGIPNGGGKRVRLGLRSLRRWECGGWFRGCWGQCWTSHWLVGLHKKVRLRFSAINNYRIIQPTWKMVDSLTGCLYLNMAAQIKYVGNLNIPSPLPLSFLWPLY